MQDRRTGEALINPIPHRVNLPDEPTLAPIPVAFTVRGRTRHGIRRSVALESHDDLSAPGSDKAGMRDPSFAGKPYSPRITGQRSSPAFGCGPCRRRHTSGSEGRTRASSSQVSRIIHESVCGSAPGSAGSFESDRREDGINLCPVVVSCLFNCSDKSRRDTQNPISRSRILRRNSNDKLTVAKNRSNQDGK